MHTLNHYRCTGAMSTASSPTSVTEWKLCSTGHD